MTQQQKKDRNYLKETVLLFRSKGASWKKIEQRVRVCKPFLLNDFYQIKAEING